MQLKFEIGGDGKVGVIVKSLEGSRERLRFDFTLDWVRVGFPQFLKFLESRGVTKDDLMHQAHLQLGPMMLKENESEYLGVYTLCHCIDLAKYSESYSIALKAL